MVNEPLMCCEENCVHCEAVKQVGCRMPDEQTARLTSDFFKAFADKFTNCVYVTLPIFWA